MDDSIYEIRIKCNNCGHGFFAEVPIGIPLDDSWRVGKQPKLRWHGDESIHDVICPHCETGNCSKDRSDWPWVKKEKDGQED